MTSTLCARSFTSGFSDRSSRRNLDLSTACCVSVLVFLSSSALRPRSPQTRLASLSFSTWAGSWAVRFSPASDFSTSGEFYTFTRVVAHPFHPSWIIAKAFTNRRRFHIHYDFLTVLFLAHSAVSSIVLRLHSSVLFLLVPHV